MNIKDIKFVYLIGIGGIGMSALARYFLSIGKTVAGYDRVPSDLTHNLINEGIEIHFKDDIAFIPNEFKNKTNKDSILIIYTPAIPNNHNELSYFLKNGYHVLKRAHILGLIVQNKNTIAIAGTHGKTTTTTLTAHLLRNSKPGCNAFLGGISKNYNSNLILQKKNDNFVVEADEYDRSFLTLYPNIAVITSTDADHLDVFGNHDEVLKSFSDFINQIKKNGILIYKKGIDIKIHNKDIKVYTYSLKDKNADFYATNIKIKKGLYHFDFVSKIKTIEDLELGIPGMINIENSIAAISVALLMGAGIRDIRKGIKSFTGVNRRFDFLIRTPNFVMIDDYAHHPAELKASIESIKELYPDKKITGIFQPHLYSRTRDFAEEFAKSLDLLDECILLDIYPAREQPIEGISSETILKKMKLKKKKLSTKNDVLKIIAENKPEVLVTFGAGNIDKIAKPIRQYFEKDIEK